MYFAAAEWWCLSTSKQMLFTGKQALVTCWSAAPAWQRLLVPRQFQSSFGAVSKQLTAHCEVQLERPKKNQLANQPLPPAVFLLSLSGLIQDFVICKPKSWRNPSPCFSDIIPVKNYLCSHTVLPDFLAHLCQFMGELDIVCVTLCYLILVLTSIVAAVSTPERSS